MPGQSWARARLEGVSDTVGPSSRTARDCAAREFETAENCAQWFRNPASRVSA